jgi:hypothetical protein
MPESYLKHESSEEKSTRLNATYHMDEREARWKKVSDHRVIDPNTFTDPTDRMAAIYARADRILGDKRFQSLPEEHRTAVLGNYYDKYVAPGYRALGYDVPDKDLYIRGIQENKGKISSKDFYTAPSNLSRFLSSMGSETAFITRGLTYAGINVGSKVQQLQLLGLDKFFPHGQEYRDQVQKQTDVAKHIVDKVDNAIYDSPRFWLAAHPSRSWTDKMDTFVGENLVQLPLYEAIGTARVALVPGETLTAKLGTSKIGQFVGRRLMEASDGYVGALLQDKGKADRLGDAVSFAAFGAALEGAAIPSRFLIKQFTSRNVGVGGTLFQEAISDEAEHELTHEIHEPQFAAADPIKNKVVTAEKVTLSQMGKEKYGKAWNQLSQSQRTAIRTARDKITSEAASEAAIHNPDLAKLQSKKSVEDDVKQNPALAEFDQKFKQATGKDVSDSLFESEQESLKQQSGIKQSQGIPKKLNPIRQEAMNAFFEGQKVNVEAEARRFAQFKTSTINYFVNRAKASGPGLAAEIKDMDSDEFTESIQEQLGNFVKFENPEHALLWANQFRSDLPTTFKRRLTEELHELNPNETVKDWDEQSKNLSTHMRQLAFVGRLFSEGNVFRSTRVDNWLDKTKWQEELRGEVEGRELAILKRKLSRYPKLVKNAQKQLMILQNLRKASPDVFKHAQKDDEIEQFLAKKGKEWAD